MVGYPVNLKKSDTLNEDVRHLLTSDNSFRRLVAEFLRGRISVGALKESDVMTQLLRDGERDLNGHALRVTMLTDES